MVWVFFSQHRALDVLCTALNKLLQKMKRKWCQISLVLILICACQNQCKEKVDFKDNVAQVDLFGNNQSRSQIPQMNWLLNNDVLNTVHTMCICVVRMQTEHFLSFPFQFVGHKRQNV